MSGNDIYNRYRIKDTEPSRRLKAGV